MAKSKNHTHHNQNRKDHRNRIRKPKKKRITSKKGLDQKFTKNLRYVRKHELINKVRRRWQRRLMREMLPIVLAKKRWNDLKEKRRLKRQGDVLTKKEKRDANVKKAVEVRQAKRAAKESRKRGETVKLAKEQLFKRMVWKLRNGSFVRRPRRKPAPVKRKSVKLAPRVAKAKGENDV